MPRTAEQNEQVREQTRQKIMESAFELFASQGYHQASMAGIAAAAGISKGLIYHYFESKTELLRDIFAQMRERSTARVNWNEGDTAILRLRKMIDLHLNHLEDNGQMKRFSLLLALQKDSVKELEEMVEAGRRQWMVSFEKTFAELGYYQPLEEAFYLASLLDGISLRYLASEGFPLGQLREMLYRNYKV